MLPQIIIENHTIRDVIADEPVLVVDYDASQRGTTATWSDNGNEIGACVYIVQPDGTKLDVVGEFSNRDVMYDKAIELTAAGLAELEAAQQQEIPSEDAVNREAPMSADDVSDSTLQLNNTLAEIQRQSVGKLCSKAPC
jgi:hypothetical protein